MKSRHFFFTCTLCNGSTGKRDKVNGNEIMSRQKLKDVIAKARLPSSLSYLLAKNHISRALFKLTFHFCFNYVASASPLYHFHCLFLPCAASLPHFCPPLLPPFILRDSGQGLLQFPLLMASPCYCGQTSAVSVLVP